MIKILFLSLAIVVLLLQPVKLYAQEVPDSAAVRERIQCIQEMLNKSKPSVDGWWYGWLAGYSAATVVQGVVYFSSTDLATKQDMALGAGTTFLGAALQAITPLHTGKDADMLSKLPETTSSEQLKKLERAEELLKFNATVEKVGSSWQIHALNEAVNLSSGLITWLGYKRSVWDGVSNFLLNSVITETQIWTQPTQTLKDYKNYCRKYKSNNNPITYQPQPEYYLRTYPGGVSLSIVF